jgi:molybdopterin-biosynthesis enzyme MoeA-like protein
MRQPSNTVRDALGRSDIIISTGIGPYRGRCHPQVFARVTGRQLTLDYEMLAGIRERFASRGYQMTPNNDARR